MHARCPHCQNPIEVVEDDDSFEQIDCSSCGSQFSLIGYENLSTIQQDCEEERSIAHFTLTQEVGMGAFGTVWKAREIELANGIELTPSGERRMLSRSEWERLQQLK